MISVQAPYAPVKKSQRRALHHEAEYRMDRLQIKQGAVLKSRRRRRGTPSSAAGSHQNVLSCDNNCFSNDLVSFNDEEVRLEDDDTNGGEDQDDTQ